MNTIYYSKIGGRMFCPEFTIPIKYYHEFRKQSSPTFNLGNVNYHSLARTRRFFRDKGLSFMLKEVTLKTKEHHRPMEDYLDDN